MMTRKGKLISKETKALIREQVLSGKSKSQVARDLNLSFRTIWNHTQDIHTQKGIPKETKERIRKEVISGKSKYRVAMEYNISFTTIYGITKDLQGKSNGWSGIRGKTLNMLQELVAKGYVAPTGEYVHQQFLTLRKHFPTVYRISIYHEQIFLLKGREDDALRAFLEKVNKKIISYQELRQVTDVFHVSLSKREKDAFLGRNRGHKRLRNHGVQRQGSLRENRDSLAYFYIRRYCILSFYFRKAIRLLWFSPNSHNKEAYGLHLAPNK